MRIPVLTVALTVGLFVAALSSTVGMYTVRGDSMQPDLESGQLVIVNRLAYVLHAPKPGDILVVEHPNHADELLVKRVREVNPAGTVFLTGDNSPHSLDSRHFGAIRTSSIRGRVIFVGR